MAPVVVDGLVGVVTTKGIDFFDPHGNSSGSIDSSHPILTAFSSGNLIGKKKIWINLFVICLTFTFWENYFQAALLKQKMELTSKSDR